MDKPFYLKIIFEQEVVHITQSWPTLAAYFKDNWNRMTSAKDTGNTDEKLEIFCDPCQIEDEHIIAVSYCEECNEYLCKHCHKAHRRLAVSREHAVKEQNDLPEKSVSKLSKIDPPEKCFAHENQVIDHCCISHEELCCSVCLSKRHRNCKDVVNIVDCSPDFDMQKEENDVNCKLRGLADDLNDTMYLVQTSLKAIEHNHDMAHSNMLKAKNDAFEHIENIYGTLNEQLCKTREEDLDKIMHYKVKCDAVAFNMKTLESYLRDKKKCSKNQLFMAMKSAVVKIKSDRYELKEIKFNTRLNVTRYRFVPDSGIINLKTQPNCFGTLNILQNAIKSANQITSLKAGDKDDAKVCCVTGISVLSTSRLVLVDRNNTSVKLIDTEQDSIMSKVKFESAPWDLTVISDKQIAVTVPDQKTVEFLSISKDKTLKKIQEKQIQVEGKCYGITNSSERITVVVSSDGQPAKLEMYDLDGTLLSSVKSDVKNPQYIISNAENTKIYTSDKTSGRYITERSSADLKKLDTLSLCRGGVTGMTIDKAGVLYYCYTDYYYGRSEIDSVYTDEKQGVERKPVNLLSDVRPHSKCLAFCNETNRLFVGKDGNDIWVYIVL